MFQLFIWPQEKLLKWQQNSWAYQCFFRQKRMFNPPDFLFLLCAFPLSFPCTCKHFQMCELSWLHVCRHEWLITDFNYGANIQFIDVILSHICTACNDGWLVLYHIFYTFIYNFPLHEKVKSPTMWLMSHLSVLWMIYNYDDVTVSVALKYLPHKPLIM